MIEIYLLEHLIAFEKYKSLSRAAGKLGITQPALTRSMKKLEEGFGVPLFERSKSRISLNETGKTAARYAAKVLEADREMVEQTVLFDRSRRTVVLGACAALPAERLLPVVHEQFRGMTVTTEIADEGRLIDGLKSQAFQLVILHDIPNDSEIYCRRYMDEQLAVTFTEEHPLASKKAVSFADLKGISILAHGGSGFWIDICREHLDGVKLLVQDDMGALDELVDMSTLPVFNSDRAAKPKDKENGRITVPVTDEAAHITYYLACLERSFDNTYSVPRGQTFDVPFQNPENLTGRRDV